ncbi:hypothetical protein JHFBIEKO_2327 [Methylobacterium mesophilicum]|uniref:hypothetical protein n=1 Tax=Methylobacterium mesophilicum TaxID=39956 RepID=UPI001EE2D4D6|nr:hypothetical protein [Methylobacterium mesophilicum]GJE21878.1 hypothetical protein JHFBIEKO_2327 [Methylobacterium mesophilicum]
MSNFSSAHKQESYEDAIGRIGTQLVDECDAAKDNQVRSMRVVKGSNLALLSLRVRHADNPDAQLDRMIAVLVDGHRPAPAMPYTASLDAARSFVAEALPGFWVRSGFSELTGFCSLGPDYAGSEGPRLAVEWPYGDCPDEWTEDLAPGDGPHRECYAILSCALQALAYRHKRGL